jgi:hypothetical protein
MYNHTVFGFHINWKLELLTLKSVYMLIVLVFVKEGILRVWVGGYV